MFRTWTLKKTIIKAVKITGGFLLFIIVLLVVLALVIQIPSVQNNLTQKAVSFLKGKIRTHVTLGHISLSFPKKLVLSELYLQDEASDTLLFAGSLSVDTDLWGLLHRRIQLNHIELARTTVNLSRSSADSTFNFDYIIQAFAGAPTDTAVVDSKPWEFTVGEIDVADIVLSFDDSLEANSLRLDLGKLNVEVDELDINTPSLVIDRVLLEDVRIAVVQSKRERDATDNSSIGDKNPFSFNIRELVVRNTVADYSHTVSGMVARVNLDELQIEADKIDLNKQEIALRRLSLSNTFVSYQQLQGSNQKSGPVPGTIDGVETQSKPWHISLGNLALIDNNIQYYDFNTPKKIRGIDFNHLWLTRLNAFGKDLSLKGSTFNGIINDISVLDKSGFVITKLAGKFNLDDHGAHAENFIFQSPYSNISLQAKSAFSSLSSLGKTYPNAQLNLTIEQSTIGVHDILYLVPDLLDSIPIHVPPEATAHIDLKAKGSVNNLTIQHINAKLLSNTVLDASGSISGLLEKNPVYHLSLAKFYTTHDDVTRVVPKTLLPANLQLPGWIVLKGTLDGPLRAPSVKAALNTDVGKIQLDVLMKKPDGSIPTYVGKLDVNELQLGKILGQPETIGVLDLNAVIDGKGVTIEDLNTRIDLLVSKVEYQGYTYRDFKLNGRMDRYLFSGNAALEDKNLNFTLQGDLNYNNDIPQYDLTFVLNNADFKGLHLSERPLKARGTLDASLATSDFKVINGNLDIRKFAIFNGNSLYAVDSLLFASIDQKGESKITIRSDILSADFAGTINLYSMPQALRRHFNTYFSLQDTALTKPVAPQRFTFELVLKNTDLLTEIILPELEPFVPGKLNGKFDSEAHLLDLNFDVAKIRYGTIGMDSIKVRVTSTKKSLDYSVGLRSILVDTLRVEAIHLTGNVANDSIRSKLILLDSAQKEKYLFGGAFYSMQDVFQFHFLPGQVTMHYAPWDTPRDNYLRFTKDGILAHNFSITNINERISFLTPDANNARTAIVFKDLNLQNITNLVEGTILADGLVNGEFIVSGKGAFESQLKIQYLKILNQQWGDLALQLQHEVSGRYAIDLGVQGSNVDLHAKGDYIPDSISPKIDITTTLTRLNLQVVEPLAARQLKNSAGELSGEIKVSGPPNAPDIRGTLTFKDASFTPSFVNSKFFLKNERIAFTNEGIILEDFKVFDEKNNLATVKGSLKTSTYSTFDLDLSIAAKKFQVLNTKEGENELFYGKVGINTNAKITGTITQPKVQMEVSLNDDSELTYIVPQSEKGVLEQKGIVVFVDKDAAKDPFLAGINPRDTVKSNFTGLDLTANIELDDKEMLSIVIDPVTGDKLSVKGNTTLTLNIDPTGDMSLSGRYEITEGTYDLTFYKLVKRNFAIEKGSTIIWAGDPLDATLDIRASFQVETSPMELASAQVTDPQQLNLYRNRLPFLVYLNIKGNLLTPEISFELDMPVDKRNAVGGSVYAKIKDINTRESDLNKQVFALLILRRFISDNLFDTQGGSDVSSTARRSVSKLLTEQLNRLSESIKGIELSFDVKSYEDYSTGTAQGQTEVQLGVSKSLLDDRLVVKVSGNVDIEGNASSQNSLTDYIGDIALEYKLTPDGRFRITGFRNSNYDIISGELIETGGGLIYIKDYNTLRELLKANAKEK